jgi:hypothetical protein
VAINLENFRLTAFQSENLGLTLANCRTISALNLRRNQFSVESLHAILTEIHDSSISILDVSESACFESGEALSGNTLSNLMKGKKYDRVDFSYNNLGFPEDPLSQFDFQRCNIKHLILDSNFLNDSHINILVEAFGEESICEKLSLRDNELSETGKETLLKAAAAANRPIELLL